MRSAYNDSMSAAASSPFSIVHTACSHDGPRLVRRDGKVPLGVAAARLDWAKAHPENNNVNALTSERLTDLGRAATFYTTLVEVARA
jgi:hypothetical protein